MLDGKNASYIQLSIMCVSDVYVVDLDITTQQAHVLDQHHLRQPSSYSSHSITAVVC